MRYLGISLAALAAAIPSVSHGEPAAPPPASVMAPPAEPDAIPLYGDQTPGSAATETWGRRDPIGVGVINVTRPTLTPVLPDPRKATGTAVVVAPGGAFVGLAMEHEGWKVAHALAERGIAAFVLKYRLLPSPADGHPPAWLVKAMADSAAHPERPPAIQDPDATTDGLAALALVRANGAKWGIAANRVGMIGFSAGAMTTLNTVMTAKQGEGPNFIGYIYGPQAKVDVPVSAPPMFDAIAMDDPLFSSQGFPIAGAWHAAGRPVEIHAYERGGHGFGLGVPETTTTLVLDEFVAWMTMHGLLKPALSHSAN